MNRSMKLAALAGALAVLTFGPGCGLFDGYCDDCNTPGSSSTEYQRDGLPTPRDVGAQLPAAFTPGATTPTGPAAPMGAGVYTGSTAPKQ
ncbi:MAG TPA: hypothetical protein VFG68_06720 [Fimbriiglobus sp.]|nr:hypothetical protein [Fimbriiglobus sp.]